MAILSASRALFIAGDVAALLLALPITLTLRTLSFPSVDFLAAHIIPFSILAVISVIVFFSAGLYDVTTAFRDRQIMVTIFGAQVVNVVVAALFFFFVPIFGITPKTNLVIYLVVSVVLVTLWHIGVRTLAKTQSKRALIIGDGEEVNDVVSECAKNKACPFGLCIAVSISDKNPEVLLAEVQRALAEKPAFVVANPEDARLAAVLPHILEFEQEAPGPNFINFTRLYEQLFRREPLAAISYSSFLNERPPEQILYAVVKRSFDFLAATIILLGLAVITPLVALAITLESPGPVFIRQKRIGRNWKPIEILKFRSMTQATNEDGAWVGETENTVTRVGAFLRKTSIDELPQVLAVFTGALSLIGPRSDVAGLAERLEEAIPFYAARYSVAPGISGWAQVNQRYAPGNISPQSIEESRLRLAYDLYYVKHRSPFLDLSITFRTIKTLITRLKP